MTADAESTWLPKWGNTTSALHPVSPPLLPLRGAVGRLRTRSCRHAALGEAYHVHVPEPPARPRSDYAPVLGSAAKVFGGLRSGGQHRDPIRVSAACYGGAS